MQRHSREVFQDQKCSTFAYSDDAVPIFRVSRLPLDEIFVHDSGWNVPCEDHVFCVWFVSSDPEARRTVTSVAVETHHIHLFIKSWKLLTGHVYYWLWSVFDWFRIRPSNYLLFHLRHCWQPSLLCASWQLHYQLWPDSPSSSANLPPRLRQRLWASDQFLESWKNW